MNTPDHPVLGDYANNKFGAAGVAFCHNGARPRIPESRISINAPFPRDVIGLSIEDAPPEGNARRRYSFNIALEPLLPTRDGIDKNEFYVRGPNIGMVDHVLGRSGEDYIGLGATSQYLMDCLVLVSADFKGLIFDFSGSLSDRGFLDLVAHSLKQKAYEVRFHMTWDVACFYFRPNDLAALYGKFAA